MKTAEEYKKITSDKYLRSIIKFEETHNEIFNMIDKSINAASMNGEYMTNITIWSLSNKDVKMITHTLRHYGFTMQWHPEPGSDDSEERKQYILTIHWA